MASESSVPKEGVDDVRLDGDELAGLEDCADQLFGPGKGHLARDLFVDLPSLGMEKILATERVAANPDGDGVAWMDDVESINSMEGSRLAVVGKLLGPRLRLDLVRRVMTVKWGLLEPPVVQPMGDRLFLFRLPDEATLRRVLDDGPWIVAGQVLFLQKWTIDYSPARHMLTKMPVWLRLPHFPIGLWNRKNLIAIASLAGEPLEFDRSTLSQDRIMCARIKVLVDLSLPLVRGISIGHKGVSVWQPFLFEYFPVICTSCGHVGHPAIKCSGPGSGPAPAVGSKRVQPETVETVETHSVGPTGPEERSSDLLTRAGPRPNSTAGTAETAGTSTHAHALQDPAVEADWTQSKRRQKKQRSTRRASVKAGIHASHSSNPFQALEKDGIFVQQGECTEVDDIVAPSGARIGHETSSTRPGRKFVPPSHRIDSQFLDRPDLSEIPEAVLEMGNRIAATLSGDCNASSSRPLISSSSGHRGKGRGPDSAILK